jgi:uncharacterized protein (DUF58 family)
VVLTGRAGLMALLCVLPIVVSPWPAATFLALLGLLSIMIGADITLAANPLQLQYTRLPNGSVRLGEPVTLGLLIHNTGRRHFNGRVRDAWPPSTRAEPASHGIDIVAGHTHRVDTCLRPVRRGDQRSAAVTARSIGPLGLAGRQKSRPVPGEVRVLPPFLSLREIDGLLPTLTRGQGTEFDSLREYVVGDDVRSIDWRATARRSDVVVRTWRPERDRRVVIVLDTGRTAAGRVGVDPTAGDPSGWPRLDWSMDAALLLAALASRAGDTVDFLAHDRVTRAGVFGASRTELLSRLVDAMAPLKPALIESDSTAMVSAVARRTRRRALVVLMTDLNASALDEGLLPVLPLLSTKHKVMVAAVGDPRVDQMAAGRSDAAEVYDAAAAERSRGERSAIATRLRHSGVEVVDAAPADLAPALADRYLSLKAAGRL